MPIIQAYICFRHLCSCCSRLYAKLSLPKSSSALCSWRRAEAAPEERHPSEEGRIIWKESGQKRFLSTGDIIGGWRISGNGIKKTTLKETQCIGEFLAVTLASVSPDTHF